MRKKKERQREIKLEKEKDKEKEALPLYNETIKFAGISLDAKSPSSASCKISDFFA